jgi:DNA-binding transcriptional ArsR family regulator
LATFEVGSALDAANVLAERLPQTLSQTAREIYKTLVHIGVEVTQRRGHATTASEVVMHIPVELVAEAVGVSRVSLWRHLPALRELGLVDARTHKATCRGQVRNSGTVWRVRLSPLRGSRARVSSDDLRHKWRGSEIRGAASFRALKHTQTIQEKSLKIEILIAWALSPSTYQSPVELYVKPTQTRLEALLDVTGVGKAERAQAVDRAAQALAQALRDSSSLNFYRRLLWQLLRHHDSTQEDYGYQVYLAAQRAQIDAREWSGLRKPGALLVSRLRGSEWFKEIMGAPPTRVGVRPLQS